MLEEGFVYIKQIDPTIQYDIRYSTSNNFIGREVAGYQKNEVIITQAAAEALKNAQQYVNKDGYSLVIYDAYRPLRACKDFVEWGADSTDTKMKEIFYPKINKNSPSLIHQYVAEISSHCRGSTVDVTLIKKEKKLNHPTLTYKTLTNGEKVPYYEDGTEDFGTSFDFFGVESHTKYPHLSDKARKNRDYLVKVMEQFGFLNNAEGWGDNPKEWWHFTLQDEPYPNKYFDFLVR